MFDTEEGRRDDDAEGTGSVSPTTGPSKLTTGDPNVYCFAPAEGPTRPADIGGDANSGPLHRLGDRDMAAESSIRQRNGKNIIVKHCPTIYFYDFPSKVFYSYVIDENWVQTTIVLQFTICNKANCYDSHLLLPYSNFFTIPVGLHSN